MTSEIARYLSPHALVNTAQHPAHCSTRYPVICLGMYPAKRPTPDDSADPPLPPATAAPPVSAPFGTTALPIGSLSLPSIDTATGGGLLHSTPPFLAPLPPASAVSPAMPLLDYAYDPTTLLHPASSVRDRVPASHTYFAPGTRTRPERAPTNPGRAHRFCHACRHINHVRRKRCEKCQTPKSVTRSGAAQRLRAQRARRRDTLVPTLLPASVPPRTSEYAASTALAPPSPPPYATAAAAAASHLPPRSSSFAHAPQDPAHSQNPRLFMGVSSPVPHSRSPRASRERGFITSAASAHAHTQEPPPSTSPSYRPSRASRPPPRQQTDTVHPPHSPEEQALREELDRAIDHALGGEGYGEF